MQWSEVLCSRELRSDEKNEPLKIHRPREFQVEEKPVKGLVRSKGLPGGQQAANWPLAGQGISSQQREDAPVTKVFEW